MKLGKLIEELLKIQKVHGTELIVDNIYEDPFNGHLSVVHEYHGNITAVYCANDHCLDRETKPQLRIVKNEG